MWFLDIPATFRVQSHLQFVFFCYRSGRVDVTLSCLWCSYIRTVQLEITDGLLPKILRFPDFRFRTILVTRYIFLLLVCFF